MCRCTEQVAHSVLLPLANTKREHCCRGATPRHRYRRQPLFLPPTTITTSPHRWPPLRRRPVNTSPVTSAPQGELARSGPHVPSLSHSLTVIPEHRQSSLSLCSYSELCTTTNILQDTTVNDHRQGLTVGQAFPFSQAHHSPLPTVLAKAYLPPQRQRQPPSRDMWSDC